MVCVSFIQLHMPADLLPALPQKTRLSTYVTAFGVLKVNILQVNIDGPESSVR